ncbi:MAG TPA: 2-oxoglutarate oxidoreductase [Proteobacteria bacterium]|nr:2-oxoglutarate oxidoreductase subunit KorB [bacterium BMS3Abin14]HDL52606.1 2-oxoglutarate oxidoreductase [Pseudomonadota bacterium]
MKQVFARPKALNDATMHYCPGCGHGVGHRLVAEAIDHFGIVEKTVGVAPVGCAVLMYDYFNCDIIEAPHGRPPAVATGMKRSRPDMIIFTYQGDGDLASIGLAEIVHAANRGENITVIFVNNTVYGMTGGQMAPTTLLGQQTTTSPYGRNLNTDGYPIRMAEMLATLDGTSYVARMALDKPANILKARKTIFKAFEMQINEIGFSFVELLSTCPTNWGMDPRESVRRIQEELIPYFPLGVFKEKDTADYI